MVDWLAVAGTLAFSVIFGGFLGYALSYGNPLGALAGVAILFGLFVVLFLTRERDVLAA